MVQYEIFMLDLRRMWSSNFEQLCKHYAELAFLYSINYCCCRISSTRSLVKDVKYTSKQYACRVALQLRRSIALTQASHQMGTNNRLAFFAQADTTYKHSHHSIAYEGLRSHDLEIFMFGKPKMGILSIRRDISERRMRSLNTTMFHY
jgi:hypothetical protein